MALLGAMLLEGVRVNFWVAARTDGVAGSGSQAAPFNGAQGHFDDVMVKILALVQAQTPPLAVTVHLGPGEFETKGYRSDYEPSPSGWEPRAGMKILGAGMEVTTLKLVDATAADAQYFAVGHPLSASAQADYFEIADLTIDCNLPATGSVACGAIRLMGSHARIRRVRAKRWGTKSASRPCLVFALITATAGPDGIQTVDAGIEDCLADQPAAGGNVNRVTVFHAGGKEQALQDNAEAFGIDRVVVERNVIELADFTALPSVPPGTPGAADPPTGIRVCDGNPAFLVTPDYVHGDVVIRRNILRIVGGRIDQAYLAQGIRVEGARSVALRDNVPTLTQANPMRHNRCGTARYFNNRTRAGVLLRGSDQTSQREVEELEDDAENALLLSLFQR